MHMTLKMQESNRYVQHVKISPLIIVHKAMDSISQIAIHSVASIGQFRIRHGTRVLPGHEPFDDRLLLVCETITASDGLPHYFLCYGTEKLVRDFNAIVRVEVLNPKIALLQPVQFHRQPSGLLFI